MYELCDSIQKDYGEDDYSKESTYNRVHFFFAIDVEHRQRLSEYVEPLQYAHGVKSPFGFHNS